MTKIEKLEAICEKLTAELIETEKHLGAKVETIPMYAGGSRYSLAGPGDDEIIGYKEVITYDNPDYLARKIYLVNELETKRSKIRELKEKN